MSYQHGKELRELFNVVRQMIAGEGNDRTARTAMLVAVLIQMNATLDDIATSLRDATAGVPPDTSIH